MSSDDSGGRHIATLDVQIHGGRREADEGRGLVVLEVDWSLARDRLPVAALDGQSHVERGFAERWLHLESWGLGVAVLEKRVVEWGGPLVALDEDRVRGHELNGSHLVDALAAVRAAGVANEVFHQSTLGARNVAAASVRGRHQIADVIGSVDEGVADGALGDMAGDDDSKGEDFTRSGRRGAEAPFDARETRDGIAMDAAVEVGGRGSGDHLYFGAVWDLEHPVSHQVGAKDLTVSVKSDRVEKACRSTVATSSESATGKGDFPFVCLAADILLNQGLFACLLVVRVRVGVCGFSDTAVGFHKGDQVFRRQRVFADEVARSRWDEQALALTVAVICSSDLDNDCIAAFVEKLK